MNTARARQLLTKGDLHALFIEELGWDRYSAPAQVKVGNAAFSLVSLAQKRGMVAYQLSSPDGSGIPDHAQRRKIEREVAKSVHQHLIVFIDARAETQIWQWVKRESGKPTACREHTFHMSQTGDGLLQKLQAIAFTLEEEEQLSHVDVTSRARSAFDVEKVTKRFYERFQQEHAAFLKFVDGVTERTDREWYASVMLNRLMFVYFIQRKGFLDGDRDYLRNRLKRMRDEHGSDRFYSFYRYFLLRLFHEGLGGRKRTPELEALVGRIPYLNGGIFDIHELERPERYGKAIQIPDKAFERIFDYFDEYHWHLDERPLRADNEINPDVLGYIFEKYVNQKQMGAYYTREDITEYICKNTVLPVLLDTTRGKCRVAFDNLKGPTTWDLLKADPDRYIYPVMRHGTEENLPQDIAAGLDPPTLHQSVGKGPVKTLELRKDWNRPATPSHGLPNETWRETVARHKRYEEVKAKLVSGEVHDVRDLITLNLNIRQFVQDTIESCEGPDLLRAFWHAIENVTILDPTCGSGAFLFAALNILEPLYEACLERMEAFVGDLERSGEKHRPEKYSDFRKVLAHVAAHPNRRYFVFKSIILNNLFGVDIMEEAVEICKLRLFLKLAAQVEPDEARDNLGIEPLPDIDFNIRAGNTLVGYATDEEVRRALGSKLAFDGALERISVRAADLQQAFDAFRARQVEGDGSVPTEDKQELRKRLNALREELNQTLAGEYGVGLSNRRPYERWLKSHEPFHWFVEFYGIVRDRGGFDVIVGNPPYVTYSTDKVAYEVREDLFTTFPSKNLYAYVYERSIHLAHKNSAIGLIVQLTALSSEKMQPLQDLLLRRGFLVAVSFPRRPESIFDGVEMPVTILISRADGNGLFTSRVCRFYTDERPQALNVISLVGHNARLHGHRIGKLGTEREVHTFRKLNSAQLHLDSLTTRASDALLYYQEACRYWVKARKGLPFFKRNGERIPPPHGRTIMFNDREACAFGACLMNSTLFYWFYSCFSDCEHINDALIRTFRVPVTWSQSDWMDIEQRLAQDLKSHARRKTINTRQGHEIQYDELDASQSKARIDEIDTTLARHYGLTEAELDFVVNYDIKYRLGSGPESEEE